VPLAGGRGLKATARPPTRSVPTCPAQVWFAVKLLEALGQYRTARRLKVGHIAWDAQNSAKTDRNLFFTTKACAPPAGRTA
jgi:hypothetical protein